MDYDSEEEPFASPIEYNGVRACKDNVIAGKINGTVTRMLVDSGAQSTLLGKQQFHNLVRSVLRANLMSEKRNHCVYGNGCLPVVSKYDVTFGCHGQKIVETVLVTQGEGRCLLGSPAARKLQVLKVGPVLVNMTTVHSIGRHINGIVGRFPKVFSGVDKLSGYQLKLHINHEVTPIARKPRRIPYPLKDNVQRKIDELLILHIIEKVSGPTTWVNPAVIAPKPNKDDVRIIVDIGVPTKSMSLSDEIIVVGGLVMRGMQIVVPLSLREKL